MRTGKVTPPCLPLYDLIDVGSNIQIVPLQFPLKGKLFEISQMEEK